MENKKTISKGNIFFLVLVSIFIVLIILGEFLFSENKFYISGSIIVLSCLLVILVLSNSFDNFSIGKLFTLSKELTENKEKVKVLEKEKTEILLKLFNLTLQSQSANITVNAGNHEEKQNLFIDKLSEDEKKKKSEEEEFDSQKETIPHKRLNNDRFESLILNKYFGTSKDDSSLLRDVKVVDQFKDLDSVSNKSIYFDAYLKENNSETFIDIQKGIPVSSFFHDRLYVQLNKILLYRKNKENNTQLLLLIAKEKDSLEKQRNIQFDNYFEPAIDCGLLRIRYVEYSKEEYETCLEERK